MITKPRASTRTDTVYEGLRADILAGRRGPGARLKFPELCTQFDVSVGVIREALTRLEEQGLVQSEAHHGFEVIRLSLEDLNSLTDARVELEGLVLRRAVREGDIAWEGAVVSAHHVLERTALLEEAEPRRVSDAWSAAHAAFHETLLSGCANERLRRVALSLRDEAELYRRWSVPIEEGRLRDVAGVPRDLGAEHHALVEACLTRDPELAVERLTAHITRTTELVADSMRPDDQQGHGRPAPPPPTTGAPKEPSRRPVASRRRRPPGAAPST